VNYFWEFSWKGLIVIALVMLPNIFYFMLPKPSAMGGSGRKYLILTIIEHGSQAVFMLLLLFLVSDQLSVIRSPYLIGMATSLFFYYVLWVFYFTGKHNLPLLLGMAIFPVVFFIAAELWLHLTPAIIPTAIFGIAHTVVTYFDYRSGLELKK